jgi:hypothetical protein
MAVMQERREAFRMDVATKAVCRLSAGDQQISGAIRDISIAGLFLLSEQKPAIGTVYEIEIMLAGKHSQMVIENMTGSVVRINGVGLAIRFDKRFEWFAMVPLYFHITREFQEN